MIIRYAILGLLSWQPLTGYDLKQIFRDSTTMYWSGSNNQIYRTLVQLHEEGLVTREIEDQDTGPSRKVYTITDAGLAALRSWLLSPPELPEIKHPFLIQLSWADPLMADELDSVLAQYENELDVKLRMLRAQLQREEATRPNRTPREARLWEHIGTNWIMFYEREIAWVQALRTDLRDQSDT